MYELVLHTPDKQDPQNSTTSLTTKSLPDLLLTSSGKQLATISTSASQRNKCHLQKWTLLPRTTERVFRSKHTDDSGDESAPQKNCAYFKTITGPNPMRFA